MQTFAPFPSFSQSAAVLDYRRLGKQRVEAKQIYLALSDPSYGWQHHPAVKMWKGCRGFLTLYGHAMCCEWRDRGYRDNLREWFWARINEHTFAELGTAPSWWGMEAFHRSHQSNLIRKDPSYRRFFLDVPDNLPYVWPK